MRSSLYLELISHSCISFIWLCISYHIQIQLLWSISCIFYFVFNAVYLVIFSDCFLLWRSVLIHCTDEFNASSIIRAWQHCDALICIGMGNHPSGSFPIALRRRSYSLYTILLPDDGYLYGYLSFIAVWWLYCGCIGSGVWSICYI